MPALLLVPRPSWPCPQEGERPLAPKQRATGSPRWPGVKRRGERCSAPARRHRVATAALTTRARRGVPCPLSLVPEATAALTPAPVEVFRVPCPSGIAPALPPCTESAVQFSSLTFLIWEEYAWHRGRSSRTRAEGSIGLRKNRIQGVPVFPRLRSWRCQMERPNSARSLARMRVAISSDSVASSRSADSPG